MANFDDNNPACNKPLPSSSTVATVYAHVRAVSAPAPAVAPKVVRPFATHAITSVPLATLTLPPATHTSCYVIGTDPVLVVDPGTPDEVELSKVIEVVGGARVLAIALTHHHADHSSGAAQLATRLRAPVWAHPLTAARLPGVSIAKPLMHNELIMLGMHAVTCLWTPGHAPDHVCFRVARPNAIAATVCGDLVAGLGTILIDPSEGHLATYLDSLRAVAELGPSHLLPAHGPVIEDGGTAIQGLLAHRHQREVKTLTALTTMPQALSELVARVYDDTPRLIWPLAERALWSQLIKLCEEGRAIEQIPQHWCRI